MKEIKYTLLYCVYENFCDYGSGSGSTTLVHRKGSVQQNELARILYPFSQNHKKH